MIESHLKAGRQDLMPGKELVYGLSITDACVGLGRQLVEDLADAVRQRCLKGRLRAKRSRPDSKFFGTLHLLSYSTPRLLKT
jgi:hypothetical protein